MTGDIVGIGEAVVGPDGRTVDLENPGNLGDLLGPPKFKFQILKQRQDRVDE